MDYHHRRFQDFSLLFYKKDKLVALFPANRNEQSLHSHQGLSYGGLLLPQCSFKEHYELYYQLMTYAYDQNIQELYIREIPPIYHRETIRETDLLYFWSQAELVRSDIYSYLDRAEQPQPNRNRRRAIKKALEKQLWVIQSEDYATFWNSLLIPNLQQRFGVHPTHSLDEIIQLQQRFPDRIKLFAAYEKEVMKAGALLFITDEVAHFQYSSGADDRAENGALDLLFHSIIEQYATKKYISFGTSSNKTDNTVNEGLLYWKESYGARHIAQRYYKIETKNYKLLENRFR